VLSVARLSRDEVLDWDTDILSFVGVFLLLRCILYVSMTKLSCDDVRLTLLDLNLGSITEGYKRVQRVE
jgi:hypothetical protein